jgi:hypothetical protein
VYKSSIGLQSYSNCTGVQGPGVVQGVLWYSSCTEVQEYYRGLGVIQGNRKSAGF